MRHPSRRHPSRRPPAEPLPEAVCVSLRPAAAQCSLRRQPRQGRLRPHRSTRSPRPPTAPRPAATRCPAAPKAVRPGIAPDSRPGRGDPGVALRRRFVPHTWIGTSPAGLERFVPPGGRARLPGPRPRAASAPRSARTAVVTRGEEPERRQAEGVIRVSTSRRELRVRSWSASALRCASSAGRPAQIARGVVRSLRGPVQRVGSARDRPVSPGATSRRCRPRR